MRLLPDGVETRTVDTDRLETHLLERGHERNEAVVFLHGNISSARFFGELLAELPDECYAVAPDLRGFGHSERRPIDATRGLRDFADDVHALTETLDLDRVSFVGWSTGGGIALQYAIDRPTAVESLTLINPVSPYGFGGTRRDGTPCQPDYAGTGGGFTNDEFVERIASGDTRAERDASPRNIFREFYVGPETELDPALEDVYVESMVRTATGDDYYPGDARPSENWPGVAPGETGVNNALSPKYCDLTDVVDLDPAPPLLWLRGDQDRIVADGSSFDAGFLGQLGELPGWPGEDVYPPQPMVTQTRDVLEEYADAGGEYEEVVVEETGHSPHIERPQEVLTALTDHLP